MSLLTIAILFITVMCSFTIAGIIGFANAFYQFLTYNLQSVMLSIAGICGLLGAIYWQRRLAGKIPDKALFKIVNIVLCLCAVLILYQAWIKL